MVIVQEAAKWIMSQVQRGNGTAIKGGDGWWTHTIETEVLERWAAEMVFAGQYERKQAA